jgi:translation initiation factor 2B subunit (eIF-2B alpha/beta/delta family)
VLRETILSAQDYKTPEGKVLSRDLTAVLNTAIQFLVECRPLAITMGNAIKFLKTQARAAAPVWAKGGHVAPGICCYSWHSTLGMYFTHDMLCFALDLQSIRQGSARPGVEAGPDCAGVGRQGGSRPHHRHLHPGAVWRF